MLIIKHLIYKEWIKIKWFALISTIVSVAVMVYIFCAVASSLSGTSPELIVADMLNKKAQFFGAFKFVPLFVAALIGFSQFLPEVADKRIKLALHLPVSGLKVIYSMVLFGFAVMAAIILMSQLLFVAGMQFYFPAEVIVPAMKTMLPWILGGVTAYFLIAMVAMEPVARFRFLYVIVGYLLLAVFMKRYALGNAETILPILWGLTFVSSIAILFTSHRFIKGEL